jgi:hypothetical protein
MWDVLYMANKYHWDTHLFHWHPVQSPDHRFRVGVWDCLVREWGRLKVVECCVFFSVVEIDFWMVVTYTAVLLVVFSEKIRCRHVNFIVSSSTHFNFIATKPAAVLGNAKSIYSVVFVQYCCILAIPHMKFISDKFYFFMLWNTGAWHNKIFYTVDSYSSYIGGILYANCLDKYRKKVFILAIMLSGFFLSHHMSVVHYQLGTKETNSPCRNVALYPIFTLGCAAGNGSWRE